MKTRLIKKERSWILYDCGNSAYSMAIMTVLFPAYYGIISAGNGMDLGFANSFAILTYIAACLYAFSMTKLWQVFVIGLLILLRLPKNVENI